MSSNRLGLWWLIGGLLALVLPLSYIIWKPNDSSLLGSTASGVFATILGIVAGVPVALALTRRERAASEREDDRRAASDRFLRLQHLLLNIDLELTNNQDHLERLTEVLQISPVSRSDVWAAAVRVADAFSTASFSDLRRVSEYLAVVARASPIVTFYLALERLAADTRTAAALHDVYLGFLGNQASADQQVLAVLEEARDVSAKLRDAEAGVKLAKGIQPQDLMRYVA